jgi:hypothetical protein
MSEPASCSELGDLLRKKDEARLEEAQKFMDHIFKLILTKHLNKAKNLGQQAAAIDAQLSAIRAQADDVEYLFNEPPSVDLTAISDVWAIYWHTVGQFGSDSSEAAAAFEKWSDEIDAAGEVLTTHAA